MDAENIDKDSQYDINIVLDEIFTNIVSYGYGDSVGFVTLNIKVGISNKDKPNKYIQLTFTDTAKHFNPLKYTSSNNASGDRENKEGG